MEKTKDNTIKYYLLIDGKLEGSSTDITDLYEYMKTYDDEEDKFIVIKGYDLKVERDPDTPRQWWWFPIDR